MSFVSSTRHKVPTASSAEANHRIAQRATARLAYYAEHPGEIDERLEELDAEWDVERVIEVEAAATILAGAALGLAADRKWLALPAFASAMLLVHNVSGWYPLLPLLRGLGVRTEDEIAEERTALMALRGDFRGMSRGAANAAESARH